MSILNIAKKSVEEFKAYIDQFITHSIKLRSSIILDTTHDNTQIIKLLIHDTYRCNQILGYIGMMCLISDNDIWHTYDSIILRYIDEYYDSVDFKNKLIVLSEYHKNAIDYHKFLENMIENCNISETKKTILKNIKILETRVFNIMDVNPVIAIDLIYVKNTQNLPLGFVINQNKISVTLTCENYHLLLDLIDDQKILDTIEQRYLSKSHDILPDYSKLLIMRKILANEHGYATYFKYINRKTRDNSETINDLLVELDTHISKKIQTEIHKIQTHFNNSSLHQYHIIKYNRMYKNKTKFDISHVFNVIFYIIEKYFNIRFKKIKCTTWDNNITSYCVFDVETKKTLGYVYIDILHNNIKTIVDPIAIRLSEKMTTLSYGEYALIGNYKYGISLTYNDIILIFKEFGYIVIGLCCESSTGIVNKDTEFINYIPSLMEYIAYDHDTVSMIVGKMDKTIIDHIELNRMFDIYHNIRLKCVNIKFDYLIHNSESLIDNMILENNKNIYECVNNTYIDIYKNIFGSTNYVIDPLIIIQSIIGQHGMLYSNLMNEIFAYASFWLIKKNNDMSFRTNVLNNGTDSYRDIVRNFIKNINENCFVLFIRNVMKCDETDNIVDTNCFDDRDDLNDPESDNDIQIRRI